MILDNLAEGAAKDEILASYPSLRLDHIGAALAYAAGLAHEERAADQGNVKVDGTLPIELRKISQ